MYIKTLSVTIVAMTLTTISVVQAADDNIRGRTIGVTCLGCHAGGTAIPAIVGRDAESLASGLLDYKNGKRPGTIMPRIAKGYSEEDIKAVAAYFANLKE